MWWKIILVTLGVLSILVTEWAGALFGYNLSQYGETLQWPEVSLITAWLIFIVSVGYRVVKNLIKRG